jgi:hypothetical protein
MWCSKPYKDAVKGQRVIMERLDAAGDKEVALLLSTFAKLEMLKLRLRMKPAPKPIDVSKSKVKSEQPAEPTEA